MANRVLHVRTDLFVNSLRPGVSNLAWGPSHANVHLHAALCVCMRAHVYVRAYVSVHMPLLVSANLVNHAQRTIMQMQNRNH